MRFFSVFPFTVAVAASTPNRSVGYLSFMVGLPRSSATGICKTDFSNREVMGKLNRKAAGKFLPEKPIRNDTEKSRRFFSNLFRKSCRKCSGKATQFPVKILHIFPRTFVQIWSIFQGRTCRKLCTFSIENPAEKLWIIIGFPRRIEMGFFENFRENLRHFLQ